MNNSSPWLDGPPDRQAVLMDVADDLAREFPDLAPGSVMRAVALCHRELARTGFTTDAEVLRTAARTLLTARAQNLM